MTRKQTAAPKGPRARKRSSRTGSARSNASTLPPASLHAFAVPLEAWLVTQGYDSSYLAYPGRCLTVRDRTVYFVDTRLASLATPQVKEATTIPDGLDWCEVYEDGEYRGYYVGVPESIAEIRRLDEKASDAAAELYEALQKLVGFHLPPARTDNPAEVA